MAVAARPAAPAAPRALSRPPRRWAPDVCVARSHDVDVRSHRAALRDCRAALTLIHRTANPTTPEDSASVDDRGVADAARRIAIGLPDVPMTTVLAVLHDCLAETRDARVQNFRLLLAERQTRSLLSSGQRPLAEPPNRGPLKDTRGG